MLKENHFLNCRCYNKITEIQVVLLSLNSFPHNPDFKRPGKKSVFKTLWEMEKMLVPKPNFNFSFTFFFIACKCLQFGQSKILSYGKGLTLQKQVKGGPSDLGVKNLQQEGHDGPRSLTWVIFPTNSFYIFVPLVPTCDPGGGASFDPKGHHMNKIDKGLQGDATYQKTKLYPFQFQRRRILKLVFFVPMFQLVTHGVGSVVTPKESYK